MTYNTLRGSTSPTSAAKHNKFSLRRLCNWLVGGTIARLSLSRLSDSIRAIKSSRLRKLVSGYASRVMPKSRGRQLPLDAAIRGAMESLEPRLLMSGSIYYINENWKITTNVGPGTLSAGDTVSNGNDQVTASLTGLTYLTNAFSSVGQAIAATGVGAGDVLVVVSGTYSENAVISKEVTVAGWSYFVDHPGEFSSFTNYQAGTDNSLKANLDSGSYEVTASNVTIEGFVLKNASSFGSIHVDDGATNYTIKTNTINALASTPNSSDRGVVIGGGSGTISGNTFYATTAAIEVTRDIATNSGGSATITSNVFASGNPSDLDLLVSSGAGAVSASSNTFSGTSYIQNQSGLEVNATGNTFGSIVATISSDLADLYSIENKITDGLDATGSGLVRIVSGNVYVSQNSGSIQRGINMSLAGDTINVQAGDYAETLLVNKANVSILGPNAALAGSNLSRATEAVVHPAANALSVINVISSGVTISGLTISGDAPGAGAPVHSGADANAYFGVSNAVTINTSGSVTGGVAINNLSLSNNIIQQTAIGFIGNLTSGSATGSVISGNLFQDIGVYDFGYAVSERNNFYASVNNNVMRRVFSGVHINNFNLANSGAWTVSGNDIQSYAGGIWNNQVYSAASTLTVSNNTIAPVTGAGVANNIGILVTGGPGFIAPTYTGNTITGTDYGVVVWGTPGGITLNNTNTISAVKAGVNVTNNVGFNPIGTTSLGLSSYASAVTLDGISVTATGGAGSSAVLVAGDSAGQNVTLTLQNGVTLNGGAARLTLSGSKALLAGNSVANTNFATGTGNYIALDTAAYSILEVNATGATFGGVPAGNTLLNANAFTIEDKISDVVDAAGVGLVRLRSGKVYVTSGSGSGAIGRAVGAAAASDVVEIKAGNYTESGIAVTKALTIRGDSENPTAQSDVVIRPSGADSHDDSTYGGTAIQGFVVQSPGVNINHLTIDGTASQNFRQGIIADTNAGWSIGNLTVDHVTMNNVFRKGIALYGRSAQTTGNSITNNTFDSIATSSSNSYESAFAIAAFASNGVISGNTITNSGMGIGTNYLDGNPLHGPNLEISNNQFTLPATTTGKPVIALDISGLTGGSVHNNTINLTGGANDFGIVMQYANTGASISTYDNSITTNGGDTAIMIYAMPDSANPAIVDNNILVGTATDTGIWVTDNGDLFGELGHGGTSYAAITRNTVTGFGTGVKIDATTTTASATIGGASSSLSNTISGGGTGILVTGAHASANIAFNTTTINANAIGIDLEGGSAAINSNTISGNGIGVRIGSGSTVTSLTHNFVTSNTTGILVASGATSVSAVLDNDLTNSGTSIDNQSTLTIDASRNYWGTTTEAGVQAKVLGTVDYTPWLNTGDADSNSANGFQADLNVLNVGSGGTQVQSGGRINEAILEVNVNGTVNVHAGTYSEVTVDKSITLQSVAGSATTIISGGVYGLYTVFIRASDVTFQGFTVTNPNYGTAPDVWAQYGDVSGIVLGQYGDVLNNVKVLNNVVTQIGHPTRTLTDPDGAYPAYGISVVGTNTNFEIAGNTVYNLSSTVADPGISIGAIGIQISGNDVNESTGSIHNNLVYGISAINTNGATATGQGIRVTWGAAGVSVTSNVVHDVTGSAIFTRDYVNAAVPITFNTIYNAGEAITFNSTLGGAIENNLIYDSASGISVSSALTTLPVLTNNSFENISGAALTYSGATTLNAISNWWGSANGPVNIDNTYNMGSQGNAVVGNVDYVTWLDSGTDANGTVSGFVPTGAQFAPVQNIDTGELFSSIQTAIDDATTVNGNTIQLVAGTFTEHSLDNPGGLYVDKSVIIHGVQAGIDARSRVGAESILLPSASNPDPDTSSVVVAYIAVSDVTIDGVTVDGNNPLLTANVIDAIEGIASYEGVGNIHIQNNIIENLTYSGMDFYNYYNTNATSGNIITKNLLQAIGGGGFDWGVGILVYNNFYAQITDNAIQNARVGIQTGNFEKANPGAAATISNNTISASRIGVFHNLHYSNASPIAIQNNTISAVYDSTATYWDGIFVGSLQGAVNATISGNNINGSAADLAAVSSGYEIWNTPTSADLTLTGGTVSGVQNGVFVNNWEGYESNAQNTHVKVSGMNITARDVGVYVKDSTSNTNGATVAATINGNTQITTTALAGVGVLVEGSGASAVIADNNSSIFGNAIGIDVVGGSADISGNHIYDNGTGIRFTAGGTGSVVDNNFVGGTDNGTDLQIDNLGVSVGTGNAFAGDNYYINNQSSAAIDLTPATLNTFDVANNFRIEDHMFHKVDSAGSGLITWVANQIFVTAPGTFSGATTDTDSNIQRGVDAASVGDTVNVEAGTFVQNVTVNKKITLSGAGSTASDTVIAPASGQAITVTGSGASNADPLTITNLRTSGGASGIYFDSTVAHVKLDNVAAVGASTAGVEIHNAAVVSDLVLNNVTLANNNAGFRVATTGAVNGLTITGGSITGNTYGIYTNASSGSSSNQSGFTNIDINGVAVTNNANKGFYFEKLDNAQLRNLATFSGNGSSGSFAAGIDINLKYGTYTNIAISNSTFATNGTGDATNGAGLTIKGRNDAPSYNSNPASLSVVSLSNVSIGGSPIDLVLGNNLSAPSFSNVALNGSGIGLVVYSTAAGTINLGNTAFDSALASYVRSSSSNTIDATGATFGTISAAGATTAQQYDIVDKIVDGVDVGGTVGLVKTSATKLYVTPNSYFSPTTTPDIQRALNLASASDTVHVKAGSYNNDLTINTAGLTLIGDSQFSTTISGPIGGSGSTIAIAASNVTVTGFTITRDGNNVSDWNLALNTAGISIQGAVTNALIHDNIITGNRSGIDINNSSGHTVRNNVITDNRTGLIFRNTTDNMLVTENEITNNWTVGIVFLDGSGLTNSPVQSAANSNFTNNLITGNWYGQIVDRQTGGSLPAPGSNTKNFAGNWFGSSSPVVTTANSAEPGYAAQIPVAFGGTATPPGGQPDIAGPASANFITAPYLSSGTDTNVDSGHGWGTFGFQGVTTLAVDISGASSVNEGSSYVLTLLPSDSMSPSVASWTINWGDNSGPGFDGIQVVSGNPATVSHTYVDGPNNYTISAVAHTVSNGDVNSNNVNVAVSNVNPVANDDTGAAIEDYDLVDTGNVLTNDTDVGAIDTHFVSNVTGYGATSPIVGGFHVVGQYGTLDIDSDGDYTYTLNTGSVQFLATGETVADIFTYTNSDNNLGTDLATLTVTITGTNDDPQITVGVGDSDSEGLLETNSALTKTGTLTVTDVDVTNTVTTSVVAMVPIGNLNGVSGLTILSYLSVDAGIVIDNTHTTGTIHWSFNSAPNAFNYLAVGETLTLIYTVRATDSNVPNGIGDHTVTITITGTNDAPTVDTSDVTGGVTEAITPVGDLTDTGTIGFTDVDLIDVHTINPTITASPGALGELTASVTTDTTGTGLGGVITWNYAVAASDVEYLAEGETKVETFNITLEDGHGGDVIRMITVTITGTNDDPIVAVGDVTGGVTELVTPAGNLTDSGTINFTDVDLTDVHSINGTITASPGALGALTASVTTDTTGTGLGGVITWNYSVAASAVEYLAAGETKVETFGITLEDGNGGSVPRTITVTITGTNDAPIVAFTDVTGGVTESVTPVGNLTDTGTIAFTDVDLIDTHAINPTITASPGALGALTASVTTDTTGTGLGGVIAWNYSVPAADVEYLADGETKVETFDIMLQDGHGGNISRTITVTITGTNDDPIVAVGDVTGGVTELITPVGNLTNSGTIGFTDVDLADVHAINPTITSSPGALGSLSASVTTDTTGTGLGGVITWNYSVAASAVEYLAAGQTKVETFNIALEDGEGGSIGRTITVTITGTNDAPIVAAIDVTGEVEELVTPSGDLTDTGTINFTDVDLIDTHSINPTITASGGALGALTASVTTDTTGTGTGGVITWNYSVAASAVEYLAAGQTKVETFDIKLQDGHGGDVTRTITVTITGTNDDPIVETEDITGAVSELVTPVGNLTDSGTINFTDVDLTDVHSINGTITASPGALGALTASVTTDTTGTGTGGVITWNYSVAASAVEYLAVGQTKVEIFNITLEDGEGGSVGRTITVTITGTNDAPILAFTDVTGGVTESITPVGNLTDAGTINFTDVDLIDTHDIHPTITASAGALGGLTASVSTDTTGTGLGGVITWNYSVPAAAVEYLAFGETKVETFDIMLRDGHGGNISRTITVTITGTNDDPVVDTTDITGAVTEAVTPVGNLTDSGTIAFTDVDLTDVHSINATITASPGALGGLTASVTTDTTGTGTGGVITWNYSVAASAVEYLALGQTKVETFNITLEDGNGGNIERTITVTITGTNDAPIVAFTDVTGGVTEAVTPVGNLTDSGTINFTDVDLTDTHSINGTIAASPGALGALTASVTTDTTGTGLGGVITWNYSVAASAVEYLAAGETKIETFGITLEDGNGGSIPRTITVTITGTNDAPIVAVTDVTGGVTELVTPSGDLTDSGTIAFTDVDLIDTHSINATITASPGALGELTASVTTDTTGTGLGGVITWNYAVAASDVEYLAEGETKVETFNITLEDGHGGDVIRMITVTITGTNDDPIVAVGDVTGGVTELVTPAGNLTDSGTINFTDVDLTDVHSINGTITASPGALGALTASVTTDTTGTGLGGVITWNYSVAASAVEYLAAGETKVETFGITLEDGNGGSVPRTITVTITGTNDAPIVAFTDVTGGVTESVTPVGNLTDTGTIAFTDVDLIDTHAINPTITASPGALGALTASVTTDTTGTGLGGVIAWNYSVPAADVEYLADGETKVETFDIMLQDGHGGNISRTITVTITGTNDDPIVAVGDVTGGVTELVTPVGNLTDSGTINFTDVDLTDVHSINGTINASPGALGALTASVTTDTTGTGLGGVITWNYSVAASAVEYLAVGQTKVETFDITLEDDNGGNITRTITVTITGTNDAPIVALTDVTGGVTELVTPVGNLTDSGTINFTDVDLIDTHNINPTITASGGALGALTASVTTDTTGTGTGGVITWNYSVAASAVEYLAAGQTKVETFDITLQDGHGGNVNRTITVTITGTNDTPIVALTDVTGGVTEAVTPVGNLTDSGTINFTDVDLNDTHSINGTITASPGALGALTASVTTDTTGTGLGGVITWNYTVAASLVEYLAQGETKVETFDITLEDGNGGSVPRTITVTITGSNDAPSITSVTGFPPLFTSTEGAAIALTGNASDVDVTDTLTYTWTVTNTGPGTPTPSSQIQTTISRSNNFTFTPNDQGTYTVTLHVTDVHGVAASPDYVQAITITDVAPMINLSTSANSVNEGSNYTLNLGAITDPGADTVTGFIINWGDSTIESFSGNPANTIKIHPYADGTSPRSIHVTLIDEDGGHSDAGIKDITVNNVAPTASFNSGGSVSEGSASFVYFLTPIDPGSQDVLSGFHYAYDFDNSGGFESGDGTYAGSSNLTTVAVPASFLAAGPGTRTVRGRIIDKDGGFTDYTTTITINNVDPVISPISDTTVNTNSLFTLNGTFVDPGADTWTGTINYGDGPATALSINQLAKSFSLNHTYASSGDKTVTVSINDGTNTVNTSFVVHVVDSTLKVVTATQTASGFDFTFNRAIQASDLALYGSGSLTPFMTVVGASLGSIKGSVTWSPTSNTLHWVKTGGVLAADTYTVTMLSGTSGNNVHDTAAAALDGNSNNIAGDNYSNAFVVTASSSSVLSMPDFARGAGQAVITNASGTLTGATGLPLKISDGTGIQSVRFTLNYDSSLIDFSTVSFTTRPNWTATINNTVAGVLEVVVYSLNGSFLGAGEQSVVTLTNGTVKTTAPYSSGEAITLTGVLLNESIAARGDTAIHKAVDLGDADGNSVIGAADASFISRVVVGLDTGFAISSLADPLIVGDTSGDGTLTGIDASNTAQVFFNGAASQPQIPLAVAHAFSGGIDPIVMSGLGNTQTIYGAPGSNVTANISITDNANGLYSAEFVITYDSTRLTINDANVQLSSYLQSLTGSATWAIGSNTSVPGTIRVAAYSAVPLTITGAANLMALTFAIPVAAPVGTTPLTVTSEAGHGLNGDVLTMTTNNGSITVAPTLSAVSNKINDGNPQRSKINSLSYTFTNAIGAVDLTKIAMVRRIAFQGAINLAYTLSNANKTITFTWTGAGVEFGSLKDGIYDLTINPNAITDIYGQKNTATYVKTFHRLFGDADGDGDVDNLDAGKFTLALNKPLSYNAIFDFDGDGDVDNLDSGRFTTRLNTSVPTYTPTSGL